jgi:hypothetical protein
MMIHQAQRIELHRIYGIVDGDDVTLARKHLDIPKIRKAGRRSDDRDFLVPDQRQEISGL